MNLQERFGEVRAEWLAISRRPPLDLDRFALVKREADAIVDAGHWWRDPDGWIGGIAERLAPVWSVSAPLIDDVFAGQPHVSHG